jgi:hypothetical protein
VSKRYLAGESLAQLSKEYQVNHASLHKTLMQRCGTTWDVEFHAEDLDVHETVTITIPALLPDETIRALRKRAKSNKTYQHREPEHPYLFGGMVFCAHCGYTMFGQTNGKDRRYYRHAHASRSKECPIRPRPWVRADELESVLIHHLFACFGNPLALQRAVEAATPNAGKIKELQEQKQRIEDALSKISAGRDRILRLVVKDAITEAQAGRELTELSNREANLQTELDRLMDSLENFPDPDAVQALAKHVAGRVLRYVDPLVVIEKRRATRVKEMTWEEKRDLARRVFDGLGADGKPLGIYIEVVDGPRGPGGKRWKYTVRGKLIHESGELPISADRLDGWFADKSPVSVCNWPGTALRGCRWPGRPPRPAA